MSDPQEPPQDHQEPLSNPQETPSEPQPTPTVKKGKSKSRAYRQRKNRIQSEAQQQDESQTTEPISPQEQSSLQAAGPSKRSHLMVPEAIEKLCHEMPSPDVEPTNTAKTSEADIFATLSSRGYDIPDHTTLSSTLVLVKKTTPYLEIFNTLIEQMSVQVGKMKVDLLKPSVGTYAWKEGVMLEMLMEVAPRIAGLAREVGVEVGEAVRVNGGGVRLFGGVRVEEEAEYNDKNEQGHGDTEEEDGDVRGGEDKDLKG